MYSLNSRVDLTLTKEGADLEEEIVNEAIKLLLD